MKKVERIDNIKTTFKGYKLLWNIDSQYILLTIAISLIKALLPIYDIYVSAIIIETIGVESNGVAPVIIMILKLVGVNILANIILIALQKKQSVHNESIKYKVQLYICQNNCLMEYKYLEDANTTEKLHKIFSIMFTSGGGLIRLVWSLENFLLSVWAIIASIILSFPMLKISMEQIEYSFLSSNIFTFIVFTIIGINIYLMLNINEKYQKKRQKISEDLPESNDLEDFYLDYIKMHNAAKEIRLYNQKPLIDEIFLDAFRDPMFIKKESKVASKQQGYMALFTSINAAILYLFVGIRVLIGIYTVGDLIQYVGAITNLLSNITLLFSTLILLKLNTVYLKNIFEYLAIPKERNIGKSFKICESEDFSIEFVNVSFKYPNTSNYVLKNVSLKISKGEQIAIVGVNGSGKTTLIKLLCGLYHPTEGKILLNGKDVEEINYIDYLKCFSVLFQDYKLFSLSLKDNIVLDKNYDENLLNRCVDTISLSEVIGELENELETILYKNYDEHGIQLSGGEEQKIAISRAAYKNAPILILDEPTSALDPLAEYELYKSINKEQFGKTVIFISHRLSSCKFCDRIIVVDNNTVVQSGSHDELVSIKEGTYFKLWSAQAQYYE